MVGGLRVVGAVVGVAARPVQAGLAGLELAAAVAARVGVAVRTHVAQLLGVVVRCGWLVLFVCLFK